MRIATKIFTGYGVVIVLMAVVITYQVLLINRLQSIQQGLSGLNFQAAGTALEMMRLMDGVEEYTKKSYLLRDPEYGARRKDFEREFDTALTRLQPLAQSKAEQTEVERLRRFWAEFAAEGARPPPGDASEPAQEIPPSLQQKLDALHTQVKTVYSSTLQEREIEAKRSAEMGRRAMWVSWSAAIVALLLSLMVSVVILRSIAEPLLHLTEGTRAITEGKFFYRLDTARNDEFAQLAKDFNSMTTRLNELDEMKKGFVSHVSHELKAPLASMQETIHLLLEQIAGTLNEKQRRLLELNFETGKRLSAMIGNLLDLSRLQAGMMEYELIRQDLVPLVRNVQRQFENPAAERNIRIETRLADASLFADCDGERIMQVLGNLVSNAIKFSPKESVVCMALRRVLEIPDGMPAELRDSLPGAGEYGLALFSVSDCGPGIDVNQKQKIFEQFHQVKRGKKVAGQGVGLGLAICKIIVEAHRGALWVEDNPGGGSAFCFVLRGAPQPRDPAAAAAGVIETAATPELVNEE
jgi:two-component system, NtrC family, sensor histidine kinase GlrK